MSSKVKTIHPEQVQAEYRAGVEYKRQLGDRGMYEQNRINERFYSGDQWHGVNCGDSRPLVRYNVIKRIGNYKMAMYGNRPLKVTDHRSVWYVPFDAQVCRSLLLSIRVDAGEGESYSVAKTVETLDNLYRNGAITAKQYLSRLPQGTVPQLDSLLQELA